MQLLAHTFKVNAWQACNVAAIPQANAHLHCVIQQQLFRVIWNIWHHWNYNWSIWRWSLFLGGSSCRTLLSGHLVSGNTYSYRCPKHVIKTWQIRVEELVLNDFLHHRNENRIVTMRKNKQVCCIYLASTLWQFCSHQEYHDSMFPHGYQPLFPS